MAHKRLFLHFLLSSNLSPFFIALFLPSLVSIGFNNRWPSKGRLSLLSGVLHGPLPAGGVENHLVEGDHRRHAQAAAGFPLKIRLNAAAHFD